MVGGKPSLFGCNLLASEKDFRSDSFLKWREIIFFIISLLMNVKKSGTESSTKQQSKCKFSGTERVMCEWV